MVHFVLEDGDETRLAELCVVLGPLDERPLSLAHGAERGRHGFANLRAKFVVDIKSDKSRSIRDFLCQEILGVVVCC